MHEGLPQFHSGPTLLAGGCGCPGRREKRNAMNKTTLPNLITALRIAGTAGLLFTVPLTPLFTLHGGFDIQKLNGVYKLMMTIMVKTAGKGLAEKQDRTPDEDVMLEMLTQGGSRVSADNLAEVLAGVEQG